VNHMYELGIKDVDFVLCNTDSQALAASHVPMKIQLGESKTKGRGAGNNPENGREAAQENLHDVERVLADDTQMVFITAGMGGGTGTGAAPIIAQLARQLNILTVGVVTVPFKFEGPKRINQAVKGIEEIRQHVDSLLIINNDKIRQMYGNLGMTEAFAKADNVLATAVKGIAEIITVHGKVNVDFADVKTVMENSGVSIMGSGRANGENRARMAIEDALNSPLLNNANIQGAKNILLNISCSAAHEVTMDETAEITDYILESVGFAAEVIWGYVIDDELDDAINVTIIATGFEISTIPEFSFMNQAHLGTATSRGNDYQRQDPSRNVVTLGEETLKRSAAYADSQNGSIQFDVIDKNVPREPAAAAPKQDPFMPMITSPVERQIPDRQPAERPSPRYQTAAQFNYEEVKSLDDITVFENTSAFSRRATQGNNGQDLFSQKPSEQSRFSLNDSKDGAKVRERNPYIHDNVD